MSDIYLWETYDKMGREALDRNDLAQANEAFRSAVATAEEIGAADRLVLSLRNLAATLVAQGTVADSYELLTRTLEVANEQLGAQHSQTIESHRDLSRACRELGYLDKAEGHLKLVLSHESLHADAESVCSTLLELAGLAMSREAPHQAAHYYERVVEARARELGQDHPDVAQAQIWLSTALYKAGKAEEAEPPMQAAFKILEKQFANDPRALAQSLLAGAQMMSEAGQLEAALTHQKRALDIQSEHLSDKDPQLWKTRELIATSLAGLGKVEEAIELLEFGLRTQDDLEEHRKGALLKNLAGLYLTQGNNQKAEDFYSQAADILERVLGPDHPAYLATQEERIQFFHFTNQAEKALDLALRTIRATEERFGPGHPNTAQTYASTALLAFNAERWETALELMRAAEKIWLSLRPRPEDVLANCRTNIATCLINMARFEEAEAELNLAEETAGPSLRPVVSNLRRQLENAKSPAVETTDESPVEAAPPEVESETTEETGQDLDFDLDLDLDPEPTPLEIPEKFEEEARVEQVEDVFAEPEPQEEAPEPQAEEVFAEPEPEPEFTTEPERETEPLEEVPEPQAADVLAEPEPQEEAPEPQAEEVFAEPEPEPEFTTEPERETEPLEEVPEPQAADVLAEPEPQEEAPEPQAEEVFAEPAPELATESSLPQHNGSPSSNGEFVERRSGQRSPLALNRFFNLKVAPPSGDQQEVKSFFVDLGPGGLRINSETPLNSDTELSLTLPEDLLGEETELKAQVVWQKELYGDTYLQGLQFCELSAVQKHLLNKKLQSGEGLARNSRQHFRLYRPFPIKLQAEGNKEWVASYATDLSVDGVGTRLKAALGEGEGLRLRLELEFELPTVEVEARVAWSKESDNGVTHGLQFASVGPVEAKTIKRYIDRCLEFSPD